MENIKQILIRRDSMTEGEADSLIAEAKEQFDNYIANGELDYAENICQEYFGLEPDYVMEFM